MPAVVQASDARRLVVLYAGTMFLSAATLFLVQPMFARMVLPTLGGTPAVWNTCVLFFQVMLLAGYIYAHVLTRSLRPQHQALVHAVVLLVPLLVLPIQVRGDAPPAAGSPVWWLMTVLVVSVGLPFFVVASTAPLLQRWFSVLPHPSARDPYFLYVASNAGSMVGLLGYPFAIDRTLRVHEQSVLWTGAYGSVAVLIALCAAVVLRTIAATAPSPSASIAWNPSPDRAATTPPRRLALRLRWLALAFIPSSLMLGVTLHISTDVASVPLLWLIPLALYLLTFIASFASRPVISQRWMVRALPFLTTASLVTVVFGLNSWPMVPLHLATFFVAAFVCHRGLAESRPPAGDLTTFYLWVSLGGALGGAFNTLVAPVLFTTVAEYPLALALAAFARPSPRWRRGIESMAAAVGLPSIALGAVTVAWLAGLMPGLSFQVVLVVFALGTSAVLGAANRPRPFAVAILLVGFVHTLPSGGTRDRTLFAARSFFGVHRVLVDVPPTQHKLRHGTTLHGVQAIASRDRCEPTTYFHRTGPIGQVFAALGGRARDVAVIGLGSGGLACYGQPGARWTFYEIDPVVERIARDTQYFTFLENSVASVRVVLGDGRLTLAAAPDGVHDVLVVDAFSSDAIPMHLATEEFIRMSAAKLRPDGLMAFHISNRYLDLEPVLTANAASIGLQAWAQFDGQLTDEDRREGKTLSRWMLIARDAGALAGLERDARWRTARAAASGWTDDFADILDAFAWTPAMATGRQ